MARAPKATGTAVTNWDEELAKRAAAAATKEAHSGGGQFISLKGGVLSYNDAPMAGNQMAVIIVGSIFENSFYLGDYDPDNPRPPECFAFNEDEAELSPHPQVIEHGGAQNDTCAGCPMNEWASADKGRGKACKNTRRLALLPAGTINERSGVFEPFTGEQLESAALAYLKLPVTSVKVYANYIKQVTSALLRPPETIYTRLKLVPDPKTQFKVVFEALGKVEDEVIPIMFARNEEAMRAIDFPYPNPEPIVEKPARGARGAKPATKGAVPTRRGRF